MLSFSIEKPSSFGYSRYISGYPNITHEYAYEYPLSDKAEENIDVMINSQKLKRGKIKQNIDEATKSGVLTLEPSKKHFFGLYEKKAQYTYICNGKEKISDIREKFNLRQGAIKECNSYIMDAEWIPEKGRKIFFYKADVQYP